VSARTDSLRVYASHLEKIRLGREHDGGYVVARLGVKYDLFLSGGIADDNSFERAVLDNGFAEQCDAYDPASDGHTPHPRLRFHREPVPDMRHVDGDHRYALVKLDIEGDEWPWLASLLRVEAARIAQLVVELHSPHLTRWDWGALGRLAETHCLIHAHANNWDGIVEVDGVRLPGTIETTWVRRDIEDSRVPSALTIPGPLDMANDRTKPDHIVNWPPFCAPFCG